MKKLLLAASCLAAFAAAAPAQAALVTYIGADNNVSSLAQMTNSVAARVSFDAAVLGGTTYDFESGLPAGLSISGGTTTTNSGCGALCGFNTTVGGQFFRSLFGGSALFSFTDPINAFGFYINGLQSDLVGQQTVTFFDGSQQVINFPTATGGGGAFIGFTDFGKLVSSVQVNVSNDIVAIDDLRYALAGPIPEPATWAMMILGFGAVGGSMRYRRRRAVVSFT